MDSGSFPLNLLAQQRRINRLYTHLTLCFALSDYQLQDVLKFIEHGCKTLPMSFPWTGGKVVFLDGSFQVRYSIRDIPYTFRTFYGTTFEELNRTQFQPNMLNESQIAACSTIATTDASTTELPVFMIQATSVTGGMLVTFSGQHGAMDMTGLGQLIHLFSKACTDDPFTSTELRVGNSAPSGPFVNIIAALESRHESMRDRTTHGRESSYSFPVSLPNRQNLTHEYNRTEPAEDEPRENSSTATVKTENENAEQLSPRPELAWASFTFVKLKLAALKEKALSCLITGSFISTDDILTAFVWLAITRARMKRLQKHSVSTTLSRNVDMRRFMSIDSTYPGLIVQSTTHKCSVATLQNQSLGLVAVQLRSALDNSLLTRQFEEQIESIYYGKTDQPSRTAPELEVRLSSWSKEKCYELDFGFGKPISVQRPAFSDGARDGLVYLLPKAPNGDITVTLCLREDDMTALKEDREFEHFTGSVT